MTEQPTLPDRETLRAEFYAVVREIDEQRPRQMLTNKFYSDTAESVFAAGYQALQDFFAAQDMEDEPQPRLQVVSAPAGGGKTTFALAMIAALVRVTERMPGGPLGCAFLTDQIERADDNYRQLSRLLPNRVAIWTSDHDRRARPSHVPKVQVDAADRFLATDLERYPVIVATHAFYKGPRGGLATEHAHKGGKRPRALTIVDERPNEVEVFEVTLSQAEAVREFISDDAEAHETIGPHVEALARFMQDRTYRRRNLEKPSDDEDAWEVASDLWWFRTSDAEFYAKKHTGKVPAIVAVFGFARSVAEGYAFIARDGVTRFIGYRQDLMLHHGMVLLDATADIDGMQQVCPWRTLRETPRARYDNLQIVYVPPFTKCKLKTFFTKPSNRSDYTKWMRKVVCEHLEPGQRGLIVCKKILFDEQHIRCRDTAANEPAFYLDYDGRKVAATHWGHGIGSSAWQDADAVFLFDEFYKPRRAVITDTQALQDHKATEGALAKMRTQNSRSTSVDALSEGHLLRWSKQMCLRGRARRFDEHGICGRQKLVCSGDQQRLLRSIQTLYPGSAVTVSKAEGGDGASRLDKLIAVLSDPAVPAVVHTAAIAQKLGRPWREIADILKPKAAKDALEGLGWRYVSKRGRGGSRFERLTPVLQLAA